MNKQIILWMGALVTIAIALIHCESDMLWKVQQNHLFLYTFLFFQQHLAFSGGMLSYAGTFFTQFFYHPWLGVCMLCGWWLVLMWLVKRSFRIPDDWAVVGLIPVALLLSANMELGYWIYGMRLSGYFFSATIGTTVGVALLWGYRQLPERLYLRLVYVATVVVAGYPMMGAYALAAALLMAAWTYRLSDSRRLSLLLTIATVLMVVTMPLMYHRFLYNETNIADIYHTAVPAFPEDENGFSLLLPYGGLAVCFLILTVVRFPSDLKRPVLHWLGQGMLLVAMAIGVWHIWYKDHNFHHELRMQRCIEHTDWAGVLEEGKKQDEEPTRAIVMMYNLALSRLGRQCNEMYNFPKGAQPSHTTLPIQTFHKIGRLIHYQYGLMNECHRMCMEDGVGLGWSVENLQYLARAALMNQETQVARKYLNLLRETHYYGDWADHMERLIGRDELLKSDRETGPITHMMHYGDILSEGDGEVEQNLMRMLSKMDADDLYFQEQAVLAAMWRKDVNDFWLRFDRYTKLQRAIHPDDFIPRIIQEAVYLFGNLMQLPFVDELPFSQTVIDNYEGFMSVMQQCQGNPSDWQKKELYERYGGTYYYEFFFEPNHTY